MTDIPEFVTGAFGTKIFVGDTVVYPGAQGSSSAFLNRGKVVAFKVNTDYSRNEDVRYKIQVARDALNDYEKDGKLVWLTNTKMCMPIPGKYTIALVL